jgi:hypothetical protein
MIFLFLALFLSGLTAFVAYLIAYRRGLDRGVEEGRSQLAEERYQREMDGFWERQEFFRQNGKQYMNRNMEIVNPGE